MTLEGRDWSPGRTQGKWSYWASSEGGVGKEPEETSRPLRNGWYTSRPAWCPGRRKGCGEPNLGLLARETHTQPLEHLFKPAVFALYFERRSRSIPGLPWPHGAVQTGPDLLLSFSSSWDNRSQTTFLSKQKVRRVICINLFIFAFKILFQVLLTTWPCWSQF